MKGFGKTDAGSAFSRFHIFREMNSFPGLCFGENTNPHICMNLGI